MNKNLGQKRGITLIALVITIIVLLILAGVTIATLTGDNGILTKTTEAKEESTIGEEKEKIQLSATGALAKNNGGEVIEENLVIELEEYFTSGEYDVTLGTNEEGIEGYIVTVTENIEEGRKYFVDKNGNVNEYIAKEREPQPEQGGEKFNLKIGTIDIVFISGKGYSIGEANEPEIDESVMTPIKYDGENWIVCNKDDSEWYNYDTVEKKWANVMLGDGKYKTEQLTEGTIIKEDELGSVLVWIPRYAYKIAYFNSEDDKQEYISNREDKSKVVGYSDSRGIVDLDGKTPESIEQITAISVNKNEKDKYYRVHPTFEGDVDLGGWTHNLSGIWVGKFEITDKKSEDDNFMTIPSQYSKKNIKISEMNEEVHKLDTEKIDSHIVKNMEWGAIAYLSESQCGRNGQEISISQASKTGQGGILTSSTGNIYGIYDLAGSYSEFVMGVYKDYLSTESDAFFKGLDKKYYNIYNSEINSNNIGDALYETQSWNLDSYKGVDDNYPILIRGGSRDTPININGGTTWWPDEEDMGIFSVYHSKDYQGRGAPWSTFRICMCSK